jgi:5-methylcytosine-specific restriction protein A
MPNRIAEGITRDHLLLAIEQIEAGVRHRFADSTGYDVFHERRRYAPKVVVGLASKLANGVELGPYDFTGGLESKCFRILGRAGFEIITKGNIDPYPHEIREGYRGIEGSVRTVTVNRYERDPRSRQVCIDHYGVACQACGEDFERKYGPIGTGFIHVHHKVPLSGIRESYLVDPIEDLVPVCPNCHAMLHMKDPPFTVEEIKALIAYGS